MEICGIKNSNHGNKKNFLSISFGSYDYYSLYCSILITKTKLNMDFKTQLSGNAVSVFMKREENFDTHGTFYIEWQFYTDMRDWGVKDISVYATKVYGTIEVSIWTEEDDILEIIEVTSEDDKWELDTEHNLEWGNCITPQDLQVDIKNKTLTVVF